MPWPSPACSRVHWILSNRTIELISCRNLGTFFISRSSSFPAQRKLRFGSSAKSFLAGFPSEMKLKPPSITCEQTFTRWNVCMSPPPLSSRRTDFYSIHQMPFPISFPSQFPPIPSGKRKVQKWTWNFLHCRNAIRRFFLLWIGLSIAYLQKLQLCKMSEIQDEWGPPSAGNPADPLESSAIIPNEMKRWKRLHGDH